MREKGQPKTWRMETGLGPDCLHPDSSMKWAVDLPKHRKFLNRYIMNSQLFPCYWAVSINLALKQGTLQDDSSWSEFTQSTIWSILCTRSGTAAQRNQRDDVKNPHTITITLAEPGPRVNYLDRLAPTLGPPQLTFLRSFAP